MKNLYYEKIRRYGRSKKYKLIYNKPKSLHVYLNGQLMINKLDYNHNKKLKEIIFTFLPEKWARVNIEGIENRRKRK